MTIGETTYIRRFFQLYSTEEKDKVRGHAFYLSDYLSALLPEGTALVGVIRSPYPGASFSKIETGDAEKSPGVFRVITAADVPNNIPYGKRAADSQLILARDTVRYVGEPVALVVADSADALVEGMKRVKIKWTPVQRPEHEVVQNVSFEQGALKDDEGLKEVRMTFEFPSLQSRYLESECGWVKYAKDQLEFHIGSLLSESQRVWVSQILNVDMKKISAQESPLGGQFGGRQQRELIAFLAIASHLTKRSVALHFSPEEQDIGSYGFHGELRVKYCPKAKKLKELSGVVSIDAGSYEGSASMILERALEHAASIYTFESIRLKGDVVLTPTHPRRALKGEGLTAITWVTEQLVEKIAKELEVTPLELRRENVAYDAELGAKVLEEVEKLEKPFHLVPVDRSRPIWDEKEIVGRGYGFQVFHPTSTKEIDYSEVSIDLQNSGSFVIRTSNITLDLHLKSALCEVAATVLKTHPKAFTVEGKMRIDIDRPARRETYPEFYYLAQATWHAAALLKEKILKAGKHALHSEKVSLQDGAVVEQSLNKKMGYRELAFTHSHFDLGASFLLTDIEKPHGCSAGAVARVSFHPLTGAIRVDSLKVVLDAGPVLFRKGLEVVLDTACSWAMAALFSSELQDDQPIPTPLDGPEELNLVTLDYPLKDYSEKPPEYFGSRGVTSVLMSAVLASLVNAIQDAKGIGLDRVPMSPEFMFPKKKTHTVHTIPFKR